MTRSEMILEFIDGTLDGDVEQSLFDELARQPDMRAELRQFIAIGDAVRSDREAFMPPAQLERALMSGLGLAPYAIPLAEAGGAAAAGAASAGSGLMAKFAGLKGLWTMVAAFVAGAMIAGSGVYIATTGDGADALRDDTGSRGSAPLVAVDSAPVPSRDTHAADAARSAASAASETAPGLAGSHSSSSGMTSRGVDNASRNAIPSQAQENVIEDRASARNSLASRRDRTDNVARRETRVSDQPTIDQPAADQPGNDQATSAQQLANVEAVAPRSAHLPPVDSSITHEARAAQRPLEGTSTPLDPLADESRLQLRTFSAEVRKQAANHFFANTARVTPGSVFEENISLGLYFRASSVMQITAEGGRERYAQRLNVNNGDTIAIDQKPNLLWLGLGLRYLGSEDLFISGMHPYLHMTAGYAFNAGPLVRARIGVRQTIVEGERFGLALTGAFEASSLVYTYNRQALLSGRYGGTFGVEVGAW